MPNWITNKITAPTHVILAMLNDKCVIDFNKVAPFEGPINLESIYMDAEQAAEIVCGVPLSTNPLLASLEAANRERFDIKELSEESFRQFVGMLQNWRACGYLHSMDFARKVWGTKWNACKPTAEPEQGRAQFETAWACPEGVLRKLSQRFPDDEIHVTYADEDIGNNCGTFTLKGGRVTHSDIAGNWRDMDEAERAKWKGFAYYVKGWNKADDGIEA